MTTVLPVESPIVTITPSTCAVTAIIGTNMTKYQHIIWENYIQLEFGEPGYPNGGFSESYSWDKFDCLYVQEIHRDGLATSEVREIIIQGLKKNQYILTGIDRFDLSVYQEQYHKEHMNHDVFIFGFDPTEKMLLCADFFDGHYQRFRCSTFEMCNAISNYPMTGHREKEMDTINLLSLKSDGYHLQLNTNTIRKKITDFLAPCDWTRPYSKGISFFDYVAHYLNPLNRYDIFDPVFALQLILQHVQVMEQRLLYCKGIGVSIPKHCVDDIQAIERSVMIVRNHAIKRVIKNIVMEDLAPTVLSIKDKYSEALYDLLLAF